MQNENKKSENLNQNSSEKMNYYIKTMNSDLKNEGFVKSSFSLSNKEKTVEKKEDKKDEIKKETIPKKVPNPFLKELDLVSKNAYNQNDPKKPEIKKIEKNKIKPLSPVLEKKSNNQPFLNNKLLIVLFFISLTAIFAGIYYFYSTQKINSNLPALEKQPEIIQPEILTSLPEKLKNSENIILETETDLTSLLLEKKGLLSNNTINYYKITKDGILLSSKELLTLLNIQFPEEILSNLENGWINLYSQGNILKMSLILKTKDEPSGIVSFLENNEYRLPELLKSLFIDETFTLQDEPLVFQESKVIKDVRYYNFTKGFSDKSIDWGIINNEYLILTTSKETALKLIEDLKVKEILLETSNEIEAKNL